MVSKKATKDTSALQWYIKYQHANNQFGIYLVCFLALALLLVLPGYFGFELPHIREIVSVIILIGFTIGTIKYVQILIKPTIQKK